MPNLNKFIGFCLDTSGSTVRPGDSYSEQLNGALRPTPEGVPLIWTIGTYSIADLKLSGTTQDLDMADQLEREGRAFWQHREAA